MPGRYNLGEALPVMHVFFFGGGGKSFSPLWGKSVAADLPQSGPGVATPSRTLWDKSGLAGPKANRGVRDPDRFGASQA